MLEKAVGSCVEPVCHHQTLRCTLGHPLDGVVDGSEAKHPRQHILSL